jgi:uncharacterized membrane protein
MRCVLVACPPLETSWTCVGSWLPADTWWGLAAVIWIATGLWRLVGGLEKGTDYYRHNYLFWVKDGLLGPDTDP